MTGKVLFCLAVLIVIPTALVARDLHALAKRERARRERLRVSAVAKAPSYDNQDLARIHAEAVRSGSTQPSSTEKTAMSRRQWVEEAAQRREREQFWRAERRKHNQQQRQLAAKIARLEWRAERRREQLRRSSQRLSASDDPTLSVIQSSLDALRAEQRKQEENFLERGRRDGALPGWLR